MERASHQNQDGTSDSNRRVGDYIEKVMILSFNYPVFLRG